MAIKTYNGQSYDPTKDYTADYNANKASGATQSILDGIQKARAAKIYGEGLDQYYSSVDPQYQNMAPKGLTTTANGYSYSPSSSDSITGKDQVTQKTTPTTTNVPDKKTNNTDTGYGSTEYNDTKKTMDDSYNTIKNYNSDPSKTISSATAASQALDAANQARLNAAKQREISAQQAMIDAAPQNALTMENGADVRRWQGADRIKNMLQSLGLAGSGFGLTAQNNNDIAANNEIGAYERQKQDTINAAQRAITDINAAADQQQLQYAKENYAQLMDRIAQIQDTADSRNLDKNYKLFDIANTMNRNASSDINSGVQNRSVISGITGFDPNTGNRTLAGQGQDINTNFGIADRTGYLDGQQTMQGKTNDAQLTGIGLDNEAKAITNSFLTPQLEQEYALGERQLTKADLDNMTAQETLKVLPTQLQQSLKQGDLQIAGLEISNKIQQLNLDALPEQIKLNIKKINQDLEKGDLENAALRINNTYLPQQLKAQIQDIYASTAGKYADIRQGDAQIKIQQQNADTSRINANTGKEELALRKSQGQGSEESQYMSAAELKAFGEYDDYITKQFLRDSIGNIVPFNQETKQKLGDYVENLVNNGVSNKIATQLVTKYDLLD